MARNPTPAPSKLWRHWLRVEGRSSSSATAHEVRTPGSVSTELHAALSGLRSLRLPSLSAGSSGALGKLEKLGFPKEAFYGAITSGEVCHQALQSRPDEFYRSLGKRCVHITWGARGAISLGDLDVEVLLPTVLLRQPTGCIIARELPRTLERPARSQPSLGHAWHDNMLCTNTALFSGS